MKSEDWVDWKTHPVTREVFREIERILIDKRESIAAVDLDSMERTALRAAHFAGVVEGLRMLTEIEPEIDSD